MISLEANLPQISDLDAPILHLVRHGRVPNYDTDQSLTEQGAKEALEAGRKLAQYTRPGETIYMYSSPSRRARETAALYAQGLSEKNSAFKVRLPVEVDDRLHNCMFRIDGLLYDVQTIHEDMMLWRAHNNPTEENKACSAFVSKFWANDDPNGLWLAEPTPYMESPDELLGRVLDHIHEKFEEVGETDGVTRIISLSHSASIRSLAKNIWGSDPGGPVFSSFMSIAEGKVYYQGKVGDLPGRL